MGETRQETVLEACLLQEPIRNVMAHMFKSSNWERELEHLLATPQIINSLSHILIAPSHTEALISSDATTISVRQNGLEIKLAQGGQRVFRAHVSAECVHAIEECLQSLRSARLQPY